MSTADKMAKAYKKNKGLIDKKEGLPSNKMANSGKKTVDPTKNTTTNKKEKPKSTGLPSDSKSRDIGKDVDPDSADKRKEKYDTKVKDKAQDLKNKVGDVANTVRKKAKSAVSATTSVYGTSSFNKEDYNYVQEYLKLL